MSPADASCHEGPYKIASPHRFATPSSTSLRVPSGHLDNLGEAPARITASQCFVVSLCRHIINTSKPRIVCLNMSIPMSACLYTFLYLSAQYLRIYLSLYIYVSFTSVSYLYVYVYMYTYTYTHTPSLFVSLYLYMHLDIYIYTHLCCTLHLYIHIYLRVL